MEKEYKNIFENLKEVLIAVKEEKIIYANKQTINLLGYELENILGKNFFDLIEEKNKEQSKEKYIRAKGDDFIFETKVIKKDNTVIDVEIYLQKIKTDNDFFDIIVLRDISARKKAEEVFRQQEERFHAIADNIPDMVARFDEEGRYVYINKAAEKEFNIPRENFFWKTDKDLDISNDRSDLFLSAIKSVFLSKKRKTFYSEITINNEKKYYYTTLVPEFFKDGSVNSVLSITRDITEIKDIDQAKTEFISITSHQLRSPLSIISWCTLLLLRGEEGEVKSEQREYLEKIYESTRNLIKITDSFLNTTMLDLEMFVFNLQEVNIVDISKSIIKEFEEKINKNSIIFNENYDNFPLMKIDSRVLKIIFRAILSNAFSYTPENGSIDFNVRMGEEEILLEIGDSGCGIDIEDREKIFTKFYRAEKARSMRAYGTGLDLYLIKALLEKLGGSITVESPNPKFGKGSVFYVKIPMIKNNFFQKLE